MDFKEYQEKTADTAIYPPGYVYPALGLSGEVGEVAELIKKAIRDEGGKVSNERLGKLRKELGDVLWYLSQLATELGLELDDIARVNLAKLKLRQANDRLSGDGSDR